MKRKLTLDRDTVRRLTSGQLDGVAGGLVSYDCVAKRIPPPPPPSIITCQTCWCNLG